MTSSSKLRKTAGILLLIFLVALLAALTAVRIQGTRTTEAVPAEGNGAPRAEEEEMPDPSEVLPTTEPTLEPTPESTPEPSPDPIARPLREVSLCTDNLDETLFSPAEQRGTVEVVQYKTHDYPSGLYV